MSAEERVLDALGLGGRPVVKLVLTLEYGQVPTVEITEHRIDLLDPDADEIPAVLTTFELVERPATPDQAGPDTQVPTPGRRSASGVPLCDHGQAEGTCAMTGCWATRVGRSEGSA